MVPSTKVPKKDLKMTSKLTQGPFLCYIYMGDVFMPFIDFVN